MTDKAAHKKPPATALGMCLGIAIGAAWGISTDNLAVGVGADLAMGLAIGAAIDKKRGGSSSEDPE